MLISTSISSLLAPIAEDMAQVDRVIRTQLASDVSLIQDVSKYIIGAGGKRLRPALLLLFARALGYEGAHHHLLAAVVECIHTATLLHDDVVDDSTLRRGHHTANTVFGNPASVLVGDFLYSRAFQMMVVPGNIRVMQILADATNTIAEGEVLQLLNMHDPALNQARYLQVIRFKTAKLFEAAARLGAVLAQANASTEEAAAKYGQHIGTAFQLIDDLLDYSADAASLGKNIGDDLREGKSTLPLIFLLEHGTPEQQALTRQAIEEGGTPHFDKIYAAIQSSGALDYTQKCAEREVDAAAAAIAQLPASPFQNSLLELCAFSVQRQS
ncbi:MAG: polyprenyl synthetase family protein [Ottowia sp.]|nr:polyprenyl synthetase family protein [Ottowia sp.]